MQKKDYDLYLNQMGIIDEKDRAAIVEYVRTLFNIAIETLQASPSYCYD